MKKHLGLFLFFVSLWCSAFTIRAVAQGISFAPPIISPVGSNAGSVAVGDFNGDGILDLAVTVCNGCCGHERSSVAILLSNGDGTFQPPMLFEVGYFPSYIAVGDFNGDGILDLAVANTGFYSLHLPGSLSILLGNGNGTFRPQSEFELDMLTHFTRLAVGDFNGDSVLDLASASYDGRGWIDGGCVRVRLGNGDGTFQPPRRLCLPGAPRQIVVGDFDNDGTLDLVVTSLSSIGSRGGIFFVAGNGDGTFQDYVGVDSPGDFDGLAAADFRNIGNLDLAVTDTRCCGIPGQTSVKLGNGDGSFQTQTPVDRPANNLVTASFRRNGVLDIAGTLPAQGDTFDNRIHIILGNGDGTFQKPVEFDLGEQTGGMVVGDFNGDGLVDLVVLLPRSRSVAVLLNNSSLAAGAGAPMPLP